MRLPLELDIKWFKKAIVLFWAVWWIIALWTDVLGGIAHLGLLTVSWAPDNNYPFLVQSLAMYHVPTWLEVILFCGIILWSLFIVVLFCKASAALGKTSAIWVPKANYAFIVSLCFWLAFFIGDQLVMNYDLEQNHMVQGGFQLLTFLALLLMPENKKR